ncbi:bifunctional acetate--CoA ligase family protein/GNAT family N-acetyltransferase [Telmatospirillum sp.]|uniref:bifunctional acetate--CoA ligase family protein/GNAT family N-acetyltransferase n=1 Tax=Telmatospirillum sp. TaxID=2079197 RepID=UPI00284F0C2F|nr:bifunctional acetate--CoA ligase family protein/GNAT family N-acetyltransferase [Telmatospirillum sp.]MDR3439308.1 bifunctional acetate--CoA ligase family protein/GNAT family N-acetyltransferase [Telmatospirillum sp.]
MSIRNLSSLFRPKSVAVIGASEQEKTIGAIAMRNLMQGGFSGPIMPVNPKRQAVAGVFAYPDVESLPLVPDLGVICGPAAEVPLQIDKLGQRGTHAAIVLSGGLSTTTGSDGRTLYATMMDHARRHGMRVLGPDSLGIMVPAVGLNASYAHQTALPGRIAFISQSGALCNAVLDWARPKGIGFSHFISLGESADVGFGDLLDYLGSDPSTRAILLYIESIRQRRNFMSAARAAARNKPVLAIKAGRQAAGAKAAATHTGALAGTDAVYDAALRRAGMLRVYDLDEMFTAVETLSRSRPTRGTNLTLVTNGGGIGVMAVDELADIGGELADLTPATIEKLDHSLSTWSRSNPVQIGVSDGERYVKALDVLLEAPEVESILVMHAPTALTSATEIAEQVIKSVQAHRANVMTCWVGQEQVAPGRRLLREAGIPTYETPGSAVRAFMHLVNYRKNQDMLMETPASALADFTPATATTRLIVENALAAGGTILSEPEAKAVLAAYGIPTVETLTATTPEEAGRLSAGLGGLVALKILSPDIVHKTDVGGVVLNLQGAAAVEEAARLMLARVVAEKPEARMLGFTVQRMARRPGAQEIIIGVTTDPIFGPVIMFGQGGIAVEVINDSAIGLPPLNMTLARELVQRTRVAKLLQGYRNRPAADLDAICMTLMKVSQLIIDVPEILELDINPLFADAGGVLAVDARISITAAAFATDRLAIRPYPKAIEEILILSDGRQVLVRPIRPEDEPNHHVFISKLTPEDIRFRFFGLVGELPHSEMARLTQIDYDREMAFIATVVEDNVEGDTLGVVRTVSDPDNERAEFAVVVRSDLKGSGLGRKLMMKMIDYCRGRGTGQIVGQILTDNTRMLKFVESLGFKRLRFVEGDIVEVCLDLRVSPKPSSKLKPQAAGNAVQDTASMP